MKYFIIGLHSSGKQAVVDILTENGIKCGKHFSNYLNNGNDVLYNGDKYEIYDINEINKIFENSAYIYMQEIPSVSNINVTSHKYYEGISKYEFDNNEVFILSPDQLINVPQNAINEQICFIWMDNTRTNRKNRHNFENRQYIFNEREEIERRDINTAVKTMYSFKNSSILYFTNEEPERVATIMYSVIKHPELLDMYKKYYN